MEHRNKQKGGRHKPWPMQQMKNNSTDDNVDFNCSFTQGGKDEDQFDLPFTYIKLAYNWVNSEDFFPPSNGLITKNMIKHQEKKGNNLKEYELAHSAEVGKK